MKHSQPSNALAHIHNISFFRLLGESFQQEFIANLESVHLTKDEYLFHQGDAGDDGMYVVVDGHLRVFVTDPDGTPLIVDEHGPGAVVGEIGTITGSRRTATIRATVDSDLLKTPKKLFDRLQKEKPEVVSQALQLVLQRLRRPQLFSVLPDLFGPLDLATFDEIEAELTWVHLPRGECLIQQGDMDENLYVLISGRLQAITTDQTGHKQVVGEISPGESVGEMQLLTGEARSASVYSIRDCELVQLSKASFNRLVEKHPQIMRHIAQQVIERLQRTIQPSPVNALNLALDIVVVPISPSVPLAEFCQTLAIALEKSGSTLLLDEARFNAFLGQPDAAKVPANDPTDMGLVIWLNQQASQYKFRLFQTSISVTPWTKRCLRQADLILLVGWTDDNPRLSRIETFLQIGDSGEGGVRKHLILLQKAGTEHPTGTKQWLEGRQLEQHHHLRLHRMADFERLVRFITRRAIGLVLGGGGVRGLAQLGVLKAIEELGLEIDLVGGSSFGAIIGAYHAMQWDYDTIYHSMKERAERKILLDYTFPFTAFSQGKRFKQQAQQVFGNIQIEDTWRTYFCISSNLSTAKEIVHVQGPLWKYIRASSALPPLYPPVIERSMVLMDGGILNNLPLDVMRRFNNGGPVIGVDVSVDEELMDDYGFGTTVSGWKILWSHLNPFTPVIKAPPLHFIIIRLASLASAQRKQQQYHLADLYIHPPVAQFGQLEAEAMDEIIAVGYQTGLQDLETWLANPLALNPYNKNN